MPAGAPVLEELMLVDAEGKQTARTPTRPIPEILATPDPGTLDLDTNDAQVTT